MRKHVLARNGGAPRHAVAYASLSRLGAWEAHILNNGLRQLEGFFPDALGAQAAADAAMPAGEDVEQWRDITTEHPCPACFTRMDLTKRLVPEGGPMFTGPDLLICPACQRVEPADDRAK